MTASTRFLGLAVFAWAGVRAISLGMVPGTSALATVPPFAPAATPAGLPPVATTEFAPLDLLSPPAPSGVAPLFDPRPVYPQEARQLASVAPRIIYAPPEYYYPARAEPRQSRARVRFVDDVLMPEPRRLPFAGEPAAPESPPVQLASVAMPGWHGSPPGADALAPPLMRASKRLELSTWALMRGKPGDLLGPNSLAASGATLGGSQAGARMTYWVNPHFGASLRTSTPLGGARGGEAALGVRFRPWLSVPFAITAERRQRFGRAGGRNDFALFVEGGLWDRPMPAGFRLNAYAQAGVVGIKSHDLFGDGAFTLTRPLWRNLSGGFGVWGGAQPHLYRLDAGPRLTISMKHHMRIHADYRQRFGGSAFPSSGPSVTIAGDF
ncbi:hypothetical protein [Sphingomonas sp.]|uniref:hypothetical protein n=1 Tax=Sphingomonas sp. TaxID=28214 RepID=UPI003750DB3A